jgi:alpha-tubulin suppressor-like RCC1 family protein
VTFRAIVCGGFHTCAIDTDDTVWCWGRNERAQLGTNHFAAELLIVAAP